MIEDDFENIFEWFVHGSTQETLHILIVVARVVSW